jgi:hypothetical protein
MSTGGASPGDRSESSGSEKFPPGPDSKGGDSKLGNCSWNAGSSPVCAKILFDRGIIVVPSERKRKRERTRKGNASGAGLGLIVDWVSVSYLSTNYSF